MGIHQGLNPDLNNVVLSSATKPSEHFIREFHMGIQFPQHPFFKKKTLSLENRTPFPLNYNPALYHKATRTLICTIEFPQYNVYMMKKI